MKIQSAIATAALLGVLATAATATTFTAPAAIQVPAPTKIVSPAGLPPSYRDSTVTVWLKVDVNGRPSDIRIRGNHDERLVRQLTKAVSQWEFMPARRNGVPVGAQVELPVQLVEG